jgi:hypothetical protein
LLLTTILNDKLQKDETFAGVGVTGAGFKGDAELPVGCEEGEVRKAGGMSEADAECDLFSTRIDREILRRAIRGQRLVEVVLERGIEGELGPERPIAGRCRRRRSW